MLARAGDIQGLVELAQAAGLPAGATPPMLAAGVDFVLEGLYATRKIGRNDERGYHASEPAVRKPAREISLDDDDPVRPSGPRKKYYN
jgi:magnesium chelatase subunit I